MAPQTPRRSSFSRRAQYSTFFGYLAGVLGALIGVALLIISVRNPDIFSAPRSVAAEAVAPAGEAASHTRQVGRDFFSIVEGYVLAGTRFDKLQRELTVAKVRLAEAKAVEAENRRLKALLGLSMADPKPVTVTRLAASSAASSRRFATIGAGRRQGVQDGMPVRSHLGLIGRVLETHANSARLLLITDTGSLVPVRRAGDDVAAFAQGRGDGTLQIRLIDLGINPLKMGDVLVTSGAGGLYRAGTAVAVVQTLTNDGAIARVISDPDATEYVIVDQMGAMATESADQSPKSGVTTE